MKVSLKRMVVLAYVGTMGLLMSSCSEDTIVNNYYVEFENVTLNAQNLITEAESPFQAKGVVYDSTYVHVVPTSFTLHVIADETKGQFVKDQIIKTTTVTTGSNTVSLPKMKLRLVASNYTATTNWVTWNKQSSIGQFPQTSTTLYYYGDVLTNFTNTNIATLTMENPYAGIMIKKNQWVTGTPMSYDTQQSYFLDTPTDWYILYSRNNNTNTKVPITIPGNPNTHYTLSKTIQPNKSYQYIINGGVLEGDNGVVVVTAPIEVGGAEQIDL